MNQRNVGISSLFKLMTTASKKPVIGLALMLFSIVLFGFMTIQLSTITKEFKKFDYSELDNGGTEYTATVTNISAMENVNINGRNPYVVSYTFTYNDDKRYDEFVTTDWYKVGDLAEGDEITILANEERSKIKGFQSFEFPMEIFYIFYIMPSLFLIAGLILLLIGFVPAFKIYNVYKKGVVKDGVIELMVPSRKNIKVTYSYEGVGGLKLFGNSTVKSTDIFPHKKLNDPVKVFVLRTDERKSALVPPNNTWGIA